MAHTMSPVTIGDPALMPDLRHATLNFSPSIRNATSSLRHGTNSNGAFQAVPPYPAHTRPENTSPPVPPSRSARMRYPTPSFPTTNTSPFPTGTGDVEPRSVSDRLSSSRLRAVHESSSWSPGSDSRSTEFERSGSLEPIELPVATRTELLSTTGPGGAQIAAARAAGT